MHVLVIGASRGFGAHVKSSLETDHTVITMQRTPVRTVDEIKVDSWVDADLRNPSDSVLAVQQLDAANVELDAVVVAACHHVKGPLSSVMTYDIGKAYDANVLEPMKFISHLLYFKRLKWNGQLLWLVPSLSQVWPNEAATRMSKACIVPTITIAAEDWPVTFRHAFLRCPVVGKPGGGTLVGHWAKRILEDDEASSGAEYIA